MDEYAEAISSAILNSELNPRNLPTLILETGRALIDDAGYLLGTVIANKRLIQRQQGHHCGCGSKPAVHLFLV